MVGLVGPTSIGWDVVPWALFILYIGTFRKWLAGSLGVVDVDEVIEEPQPEPALPPVARLVGHAHDDSDLVNASNTPNYYALQYQK